MGGAARRDGVPLRPPVPPQRHDCPQLGGWTAPLLGGRRPAVRLPTATQGYGLAVPLPAARRMDGPAAGWTPASGAAARTYAGIRPSGAAARSYARGGDLGCLLPQRGGPAAEAASDRRARREGDVSGGVRPQRAP
ncbi:hypothetical protein DMT42_06720 [Streptomyces actuosus]|uniref:Uncharacterized protein n=1 Tax=Streptomyces actuosus TaxID=1885 RepID=A0A2U9NXI2_STRAS|nr:hypothetical protein DMT42_06720 [Streptomyces actuosus]